MLADLPTGSTDTTISELVSAWARPRPASTPTRRTFSRSFGPGAAPTSRPERAVRTPLRKTSPNVDLASPPRYWAPTWGTIVTRMTSASPATPRPPGRSSKRVSRKACPSAPRRQPRRTRLSSSSLSRLPGTTALAISCGAGKAQTMSAARATTTANGTKSARARRRRWLYAWPRPGISADSTAARMRRRSVGPVLGRIRVAWRRSPPPGATLNGSRASGPV